MGQVRSRVDIPWCWNVTTNKSSKAGMSISESFVERKKKVAESASTRKVEEVGRDREGGGCRTVRIRKLDLWHACQVQNL